MIPTYMTIVRQAKVDNPELFATKTKTRATLKEIKRQYKLYTQPTNAAKARG